MLDERDLDLTGVLGLDFVNTVVLTRSGSIDVLAAPDRLLDWMTRAGGPELSRLAPTDPPGLRLLTNRAIDLRRGLRTLFDAVSTNGLASAPAEATFVIDASLRTAREVHRIEGGVLVSRFLGQGPLTALAPIARSALDMVREVDPSRLRPCDADDCRRWFVDTSRSGRRRWCSMARCGNRAKATRYRERQAQDA